MVHLHHQIQNYTNTEIEKYRNTNRIVDDSPPPPPPAQPASTWRRRRLCTRNSQSPPCSFAWNTTSFRYWGWKTSWCFLKSRIMEEAHMRQMQLDASCSFWVFVDATNSAAALESISGETQQTANICHFCHKCTTWFSLFIHFLGSASKFVVDCQSLKYSEG